MSRLSLHYCNADFVEKRYVCGPVSSCGTRRLEFRMLDCDMDNVRNPFVGACHGPNFAGNSNLGVFLLFLYEKHMAKLIEYLPHILT
ncbi:hypothetical protein ACTXT7_017460, partial [Hymenolepis weldensis]